MTSATMAFELSSPAFVAGDRIPDRYTGEGEDISPPLRWSGVPRGTRGFVLVLDDPDAPGGTFGHWAVLGIPDDWRGLPEDLDRSPERMSIGYALAHQKRHGGGRQMGPVRDPLGSSEH